MSKSYTETLAEKAANTHTLVAKGGEQKTTFRKLKSGKVQVVFYTCEFSRWVDKGSMTYTADRARIMWAEHVKEGWTKA